MYVLVRHDEDENISVKHSDVKITQSNLQRQHIEHSDVKITQSNLQRQHIEQQ